jgi:hypothetical protein
MADTIIYHEYPSCVHVRVDGAKSLRSAVQLARNEATRHYGRPVSHYVSSGGGWDAGKPMYYTFVYVNPRGN